MRKTQLLDNNPNSIYGASKNLANVSIRNILSNPVQNDAMSQNLNMTLPKTINKDTNVEEFLGKILDCDSYLQQMYLYVYASEHQYGNHGRYSYKDRGTSNVLERDDSGDDARGAGLSDDEDEEDDESLTKSQLGKLTFKEQLDYYSNHVTNRPKTRKTNKSTDSEKTYKMTKEDYLINGIHPSQLSFLNSSSPKPPRSDLYSFLKPSPIDVMKASMNNSANRRGNPMLYNNSSKLISPIVAKRGSSTNSSISAHMSEDSLNSSNPSSIASSYHQSSIGSSKNLLQIHPEPLHRSSSSKPSSSSSSSNSSGSSHYPASSNSARSNNSWNPPSLQSRYTPYDDDGDDSVHWDDLSSLPVFDDDDDSIINPFDIKDGLITEMSKFNTKMNELYIFFKGKIKPNLKTISKQDIQDILKDMNQLDYNFTDVLHAVEDLDVFGLEKDIKHAKVDAFKQTFETNFKKSSADIISSVKAYSSLGMYSTSSVPDNILFNSKFPTFDGKGLSFIPDSVRKNMHHSHKYLQ